MNHCPLIGKDCIGNNCQLWLKTIQRESCSIELISYYLVQMSDSLDKISKDLAGKSTSQQWISISLNEYLYKLIESSGSFSFKSLSISGMDDLFLNRVLFEWLRDRQKEQTHAEITSLKEIANCTVNLLIFHRLISVLSLRAVGKSSRVLKKDHPWSDYLEKLPDPSAN